MAIEEGTNLKNYIEKLLADIADSYEDSRLYAKLSKERPEGHVILNQQEKNDFEKWNILETGVSHIPLTAGKAMHKSFPELCV